MQFSNFSRNFNSDSGILQLMDDLGHAEGKRGEVFMLGGGNPAEIPEMQKCFREEMVALLKQGSDFERMTGSYDAPQGNRDFIKALAELLIDQFGWPVTEDNIVVTNGSQASFGMLFNLLAGEYPDGSHRKILLPLTPEYIGYTDVGIGDTNLFEARQPVINVDNIDDPEYRYFKYSVNFDDLRLDSHHGALCVSRPTNPTGNVITDQELMGLRNLAQKNGIPLIIDGAYGLPFPGIVFTDATPVWDDNIVLCLSLSKLGLPGVRTGIVIAAPDLIELIKGSNAIFNLAPGRFGPSLVNRITDNQKLISLSRDVIRPYYKNRVAHAVSYVNQIMSDLPVRIHKPEGAIFLWLWFENLPISSERLYQKLKERGVFIIAGHHFFPGLEDDWAHTHQCIRVSYAGNPERVEKGLSIIAEEVRRAYD